MLQGFLFTDCFVVAREYRERKVTRVRNQLPLILLWFLTVKDLSMTSKQKEERKRSRFVEAMLSITTGEGDQSKNLPQIGLYDESCDLISAVATLSMAAHTVRLGSLSLLL